MRVEHTLFLQSHLEFKQDGGGQAQHGGFIPENLPHPLPSRLLEGVRQERGGVKDVGDLGHIPGGRPAFAAGPVPPRHP
ncbi:MAG: hypothetical protein WCQ21_24985, partial [Verrucomicrobiota bacterium]